MQIYQRDVRQSRLILRCELLTRSGSSKSGRQMVFSQTVPHGPPLLHNSFDNDLMEPVQSG